MQSSKLGVKYYFVSSRSDQNIHMNHWTLNSSHHGIVSVGIVSVELRCLNGRVLLICRKCGNVCIPLTNELWPTPHAVLTVFRSHLVACSPHLYSVMRPRDSALHNLIGAARFQALEVNGLSPQCYQPCTGTEPGNEVTADLYVDLHGSGS